MKTAVLYRCARICRNAASCAVSRHVCAIIYIIYVYILYHIIHVTRLIHLRDMTHSHMRNSAATDENSCVVTWNLPHTNKSCLIYEWVMSHIIHECVMSHTWMCHVSSINESCLIYECADISECSKLCCIATCLRDYTYDICIHIISYYTCDTTHSSTRQDSFAHEKFLSCVDGLLHPEISVHSYIGHDSFM